MYRLFTMLLLLAATAYAGATMHFKKGWQLAGAPAKIDNISVFAPMAEIVWAFDNETGKWKGYSPDANLTRKMEEKGIRPLDRLDAYSAFWIKSSKAWTLSLPEGDVPDPEKAALLHLKKGWNLVSLPDITVVDPGLFKGMKLWKYDGTWQTGSDSGLPVPGAESIATGEGFWLYSDRTREIDIPVASSALHTFKDRGEMEAFIRKMVRQKRGGYYDGPVPLPMTIAESDYSADGGKESGATDATGTNVQETGVDESDILKHDRRTLFFYDREAKQIHVYTFANLVAGDSAPVSNIEMPDTLQAMYLDGDRLAVVSREMRYYIFADTAEKTSIMPPEYPPQSFKLRLYDVSDPKNIKNVSETGIEGDYMESRLKDGTLYIVSSFTPRIVFDYPVIYPDTDCTRPPIQVEPQKTAFSQVYERNECDLYRYDENGTAWRYDYDHPVIRSEHLVPRIGDRDYVLPTRLYAPYKLDQEYAITSIGAFDIRSGKLERQIAYIGSAFTRYASAQAFYLAATQYPRVYDFRHTAERTAVYKFALDDNLSYRGRGFVDGRVLGQYSLSEYRKILRVATTSGNTWSPEGTDNAVFTLGEKGDGLLSVLGGVKGLGEKGERIRAVRFVGDKAFVVTFRQTDPFYTLDLSDPAAPAVVGKLKIKGFSEYLHPVDENRILSIGRDADAEGRQRGLQVQLFDISDFSRPKLADKITVGDHGTYSEAEHNPRAFAYRESDGLFGFPLYNYGRNRYGVGFDIYQIDGLSLRHITELNATADNRWYSYEGRGVIFDFNAVTYGALFKGSRVLLKPLQGDRP